MAALVPSFAFFKKRLEEAMKLTSVFPTLIHRIKKEPRALAGIVIAMLMMAGASLAPAHATAIPSEAEQDVLVRATLATFNDANMTGNYAVLVAKASRQFQSEITPDKLAAAFAPFRTNELFFEGVVDAHSDSAEKPTIDQEGALVLAGVLKTDEMQVKYKLRFAQNGKEWKLLGINVDAKRI
jgi:hypothetical protein